MTAAENVLAGASVMAGATLGGAGASVLAAGEPVMAMATSSAA